MRIKVANPQSVCRGARGSTPALLALALLLAGCVPYVAIPRLAAPVGVPPSTVEPRQHALSILSVDFDPPLDGRVPGMGGVMLLVSVRNEGLSDEEGVAVTARLLDPTLPDGQNELYRDTVVAGSLRPGELRVVRFAPVSGVPAVLGQYQLAVEIAPGPNHLYAGDTRSYDIVMRQGD